MPPQFGLGLRLLVYNRLRLLIASASVAMGVVVIFVELGLLFGMLDAQALIANLVRGDLLVMNIARINLHRWDKLYPVRIDQAGLCPEWRG